MNNFQIKSPAMTEQLISLQKFHQLLPVGKELEMD